MVGQPCGSNSAHKDKVKMRLLSLGTQQVPHMKLGGQRQGLKSPMLAQQHWQTGGLFALAYLTRFPGDSGLLKQQQAGAEDDPVSHV